ncbi:hypothetical protein D9757_001085 [Collybiopsis confluens]|uniref:Uncharacterized protein n=1 Tax=Collybiopsis confluens TaxID=2823264 RepID=A0A8H5MFU9_9AGAR|nr:hypothetical protein D9757_001085 [Collybiopsis confluens]
MLPDMASTYLLVMKHAPWKPMAKSQRVQPPDLELETVGIVLNSQEVIRKEVGGEKPLGSTNSRIVEMAERMEKAGRG